MDQRICISLLYQSIECSTGWLHDLGKLNLLNLSNTMGLVLAEVVDLLVSLCETPESGRDICCPPTCFYDLAAFECLECTTVLALLSKNHDRFTASSHIS